MGVRRPLFINLDIASRRHSDQPQQGRGYDHLCFRNCN
jgi:hypothetical protein